MIKLINNIKHIANIYIQSPKDPVSFNAKAGIEFQVPE